MCLLGARASRRRCVFRGSWRRRRPGAPRALRRLRRQVHLEPRPHRVFAPCGAVRVPETGRLPRFALVPRLVQSSRPVPFRVVRVLMHGPGLPGRRAVNFRCRGTVIEPVPWARSSSIRIFYTYLWQLNDEYRCRLVMGDKLPLLEKYPYPYPTSPYSHLDY